jgi:hypothetical protein
MLILDLPSLTPWLILNASAFIAVLYLSIGLAFSTFKTVHWFTYSDAFRKDFLTFDRDAWRVIVWVLWLQWPYALYLLQQHRRTSSADDEVEYG